MEKYTLFQAIVLLFVVIDPLGNLPPFISIMQRVDKSRRQKVLIRELIIALAILLFFLFCGNYFLSMLNLSKEALQIAGGIVLLLIAIRMIFPSKSGIMGDTPDGEPLVVPLAVPFVAGPSCLAYLSLMSTASPESILNKWLIALLVAWLLSSLILLSSNFFYKILRKRGLDAIERLMGMLLITMSVQMFLDGALALLKK